MQMYVLAEWSCQIQHFMYVSSFLVPAGTIQAAGVAPGIEDGIKQQLQEVFTVKFLCAHTG